MIILESRRCVAGAQWKKEGEINLKRVSDSFIKNDLMRLCAAICLDRVPPSDDQRANFEVRATLDGRVLTFVYDNVADDVLTNYDSDCEPLKEGEAL